jgi:hypothetical protein
MLLDTRPRDRGMRRGSHALLPDSARLLGWSDVRRGDVLGRMLLASRLQDHQPDRCVRLRVLYIDAQRMLRVLRRGWVPGRPRVSNHDPDDL